MTGRTLRRYPALGFLAMAALLASLLPSALRVPLSGPSTSAELAPVPGKSDSAQGDLAALGATSTGGLGSGSGLGGFGPGGRGPGGRQQADEEPGDRPSDGSGRNPSQKRCVGNPPRQTEDPLSPPCVAFFKGDNGGATAKGVTGDEIVIVKLVFGECDPSTNGEIVYSDYDDPNAPTIDPDAAGYVRYFNERFQTYGRRVHVYGVKPCGMSAQAIAAELEERLAPFFACCTASEELVLALARRGILSTLTGVKREVTLRHPPFVLSYEPDLDDRMASAAEFLCARLAGRRARFATDPTLQSRTRTFGLVYDQGNTDPTNTGADSFRDHVRRRCQDAAGDIVVGYVFGNDDVDSGISRMRIAGVTTVVFMSDNLAIPIEAAAVGWHPEWYIPDQRSLVGDNRTRLFFPPAEARSAFGFSSMRRAGPPASQPHRVAYREGCNCAGAGDIDLYNKLFMLYTGIQAAGPKLTPANLDKGLHALPTRRSLDPFTPAAYFAPGNYSFVKDSAAMWWDPTGTPEGSSERGCWRLVEGGLRYRAQDWAGRPGDDDIHGQNQPCQGDVS